MHGFILVLFCRRAGAFHAGGTLTRTTEGSPNRLTGGNIVLRNRFTLNIMLIGLVRTPSALVCTWYRLAKPTRESTWAHHTQCEKQTTFPKDSPVCSARSFVQGLSLFRCSGSSHKLRETLPLCVHAKRAGPANDPCFRGRAWASACRSVVRLNGVERSAVVLVVVVTSLRVLVIVAVAVPAQRRGWGVRVKAASRQAPGRQPTLVKHLCSSPRRR